MICAPNETAVLYTWLGLSVFVGEKERKEQQSGADLSPSAYARKPVRFFGVAFRPTYFIFDAIMVAAVAVKRFFFARKGKRN